jgi:hypothetical protein
MAILVVPWDNLNQVVGDTGPYEMRDHAPITASQNCHEKAHIVGWDSSRTPPAVSVAPRPELLTRQRGAFGHGPHLCPTDV